MKKKKISVHSCTLIWVSNLKFKYWTDLNVYHQMTLMSLLNDGIIMRNVPANRCPKGADNGWSLKLLSTPTKVITSTWIIFSCTNSISLVKSSSNESLHSGEFSLQLNQIYLNNIPYARHYNPRFVFFYPIFHCGLLCRAVSVTDNLCTKHGKSSIFGYNIRGV